MRQTFVLLLLALGIFSVTPGSVEAVEEKIRALSLAPLPEGTTVEIRLPVEEGSEDLGLAVKLADHLADLIKKLGYTMVEGQGELILRFAVEEPTYAEAMPISRRVSLRSKQSKDRSVHSTSLVRLATFTKGEQDVYRLRVSVARAKKAPLWSGYIIRRVKGAERSVAYIEMANRLFEFWGQTHVK